MSADERLTNMDQGGAVDQNALKWRSALQTMDKKSITPFTCRISPGASKPGYGDQLVRNKSSIHDYATFATYPANRKASIYSYHFQFQFLLNKAAQTSRLFNKILN